MKGVTYIMILGTLGACKCQFIAISPTAFRLTPCENPSSAALVERFFDLMFSEFHNSPPACVCIQMCAGHPTYCYPNGCLRRIERKKVEETPAMINSASIGNLETSPKSTFFKSEHRDLVYDSLDRPGFHTLYKDVTEQSNDNEIIHRPHTIKELLHKYKKLPKLEMRYNLREQVKNTKSDKLNREKNLDISKTRWPLNKNLPHGKTFFHKIHNHKKIDNPKQIKFFVSTSQNHNPISYNPVVFKKYISKRENDNGVYDDAVYLYQINTSNFTLEALIDNLIESGLNNSEKDIALGLNIKLEDIVKNNEQTTNGNINFTKSSLMINEANNILNTIVNSTIVGIISNNSTRKHKDLNLHDTDLPNPGALLDVIANMNKEIEKQNNVSIEFMERITGAKIIFNGLTTTEKSTEDDGAISYLITTKEIVENTKNATYLLTNT